jgi:hypothetical protein
LKEFFNLTINFKLGTVLSSQQIGCIRRVLWAVLERSVRSKWQLGLKLVDRTVVNEVLFHWAGADGSYAHCPEFF